MQRDAGLLLARCVSIGQVASRPPSTTQRRVLRTSRYQVKPMTVEEAALSVDSGNYAFLVFRNASTESINVLYRRKDGHLGLIEPEG